MTCGCVVAGFACAIVGDGDACADGVDCGRRESGIGKADGRTGGGTDDEKLGWLEGRGCGFTGPADGRARLIDPGLTSALTCGCG